MYRLSHGDSAGGRWLLRLALDRHATPEVQALWLLATSAPSSGAGSRNPIPVAS
jgi:hypothetical protein